MLDLTRYCIDGAYECEAVTPEVGGFAGFWIVEALGKSERLEPFVAAEVAALVPNRAGFVVAVGDHDIAQNAHPFAERLARDLGIHFAKLMLQRRMQRRKNRGDALLRAPSDAAFRRRERLKDRRMRFLHRLRNHRDCAHNALLDAAAPFRGRLERPRRLAGRHAPVLALIGKKILSPRLLD